jgi:hypothetical protein
MMILPLMAANIVLRLMIFFFLSELSREMTRLKDDDASVDEKEKGVVLRMIRGAFDVFFALYALIFPDHKTMQRARTIKALTFVASAKGTFVIFMCILLPFLVVALVLCFSDKTYLACNGCKLALSEVVEIIVCGILFILFGVLAGFRVRHYPDPWKLRREVSILCFWAFVTLVGFVLGTFFDPSVTSTFDFQLIIVGGFIGFIGTQTVYQVGSSWQNEKGTAEARAKARLKRDAKAARNKFRSAIDDSQVHSTTQTNAGERLNLKTVLGNPTVAEAFEKFLVAELGVESLMFLRDSERWKRAYFDIAPSARLARAKRIYHQYISPTGSFPVNIPSEMISVVRGKVMKEGLQDCTEDVFDNAREEINDLLQAGALLRFQNSKMYRNLTDPTVKPTQVQPAEL